MRLLDRYLLRELIFPLGYCLSGFMVFWVSSDLLNQLATFQALKLRARDVAEYYAVKSPEFLVIVLPVALLLALLYALTNHARHHEITAIRAAGVSLWRLALPYFAVGLAGSLALLVFNEWCAPEGAERAERILHRYAAGSQKEGDRNLVRLQGFTNARDRRTWFWDSYNLTTHEMLGPKVDYALPDGTTRWLFATRALYTNGAWLFFDVTEQSVDPRINPLAVPALRTNVLAMPEFTETPGQIRSEINISGRNLHNARNPDIPAREILDYLWRHPHLTREKHNALYTKLHGRLAAPWTCLVVVVIAIPFGAASGRRNVFFGVAGSVFICFAYFVVQKLGLARGVGGYVPPWLAAWSPNLLFGGTGAWLTSRVR